MNTEIDPLDEFTEQDNDPRPQLDPPDPSYLSPKNYDLFVDAIRGRVELHFAGIEFPPDFAELYSKVLAAWIDTAIQKFAAGQIEHGGDFRDIDHIANLEEEIIDASQYLIGLKMKRAYLQLSI